MSKNQPAADGAIEGPLGSGYRALDRSAPDAPPAYRAPIEKYWGAADLRTDDLRAVLEFTERLVSVNDPVAVPQMLADLAALVGADAATLTRLELRSGHELAVVWPPSRVDPDVLAGYAAVSGTHPLRPVLAEQARSAARRPTPVRICDVMSHRQWRSSALYSASHAGIDDQMCVLIGAHGTELLALGLSRHRGDFTDRQAAVFSAGRAHLLAAVRRMGQQKRPVLEVAPRLRWVTAPIAIPQTGQHHPAGRDREPVIETMPGAATTRQAAGPGTHATARQRQILSFAAEGLTDAQIGRKLGVSSATVSKHLSRAYNRLGVPNRAAAVRLLLGDAGASPRPRTTMGHLGVQA